MKTWSSTIDLTEHYIQWDFMMSKTYDLSSYQTSHLNRGWAAKQDSVTSESGQMEKLRRPLWCAVMSTLKEIMSPAVYVIVGSPLWKTSKEGGKDAAEHFGVIPYISKRRKRIRFSLQIVLHVRGFWLMEQSLTCMYLLASEGQAPPQIPCFPLGHLKPLAYTVPGPPAVTYQ